MSDGASDIDEGLLDSFFQEPEGYFKPPPEPTSVVFERQPQWVTEGSPKSITINLLGSHPLWGHHLWNAAKTFANYLDENKSIVRNKSVLELGAAGALPSLVSACNGATKLVITDYPDHDLVDNIRKNVHANMASKLDDGSIQVAGFKWGYDIDKIAAMSNTGGQSGVFDVLILCDLVFNHSEHTALLKSVDQLMAKPNVDGSSVGGEAYVFFTHHRPWLADKDMAFIERARDDLGLEVTKVVEEYTGAMFEDDPGDERVRGTVHGYRLAYPAIKS
ncbi:Protein N-terminal and lysine N-methyltransferase efm7 [Coemansia sp. RSA 1722]|nr:Protein N-terminal and lysine N-methyltransferase efm7 [Coemansia sp. RSA 486]KAJ2235506.1 Protein N-terminal and lysine N-methyltransferase efm7 [Coemansia sp. RSA 485]KAJ2595713.1 Protein N-terminal and lysine N-methyltransferase efm7 [Coemansia sp. RSA 1722]